ncbi:hypothetical protein AAMO2058_000994400 [Amorphochlora amoebiformis]
MPTEETPLFGSRTGPGRQGHGLYARATVVWFLVACGTIWCVAVGGINLGITPLTPLSINPFFAPWGNTCPESPTCPLPNRKANSNVVIGTRMISETNLNFICVTMDWWPKEKCDYGHCPWHNASLLNIDLNHPLIRSAVKSLSPVVLRLGGSLTDHIIYEVPSAEGKPPPPCHPITPSKTDPLGFKGGCLTMDRWDNLNKFCQDLGCKVVFDLNLAGHLATKESDPWWRGGHKWHYENVRAFLQYTRAQEYPILGFELGNEVDINHGVGARVPDNLMVDAFIKTSEMIKDLWEGRDRPLLIGPDSSVFDMEWYLEFAIRMGDNLKDIDVFTYHIYSLGPGSPLLNPNMTDHMLNATKLDTLHVTTDNAQKFVETLEKGGHRKFQLWCGEAGGAFNSGRNLYTNSFISGFWFMDQLGTMAAQRHQSYCRQTLIGGYYGLINITSNHVNPDYYTALLWSRLMGRKVLASKVNDTKYSNWSETAPEYVGDKLRVYAHCTHRWFLSKHTNGKRGSVTLAVINLSTHVTHTILPKVGDKELKSTRAEYIMRSPMRNDKHKGLYSHHVELNGKILRVIDNQIPHTPPNWIFDRSKPIVMPPLSYGYFVFPEAKNVVCLTPPITPEP